MWSRFHHRPETATSAMSTPPGPPDPPASPVDPELMELRDWIDDIDHAILEHLARRNAVVGKIATFKRCNRVGIRDFRRERHLLADRSLRAEKLGLSGEVIESLWSVVLWASRDRQAALGAEVPPDIEPRTVAVIGGLGGMGRCMAQLFEELGHVVLVADLDTNPTPLDAAAQADVVIVSVPMEVTLDVIRAIGPAVPEHALLADVTSTKQAPMAAMVEASGATVIGMHPLFGPSVHSLQGQRIVLTPATGDGPWLDWLRSMLTARGLTLLETTPDVHDRAMAIVQVLTHFATEVMGRTLQRLDASIEETLRFTSPVYLMELIMTARHFAQSPSLYAEIEMSNPLAADVLAAWSDAGAEMRRIVEAGDRTAFVSIFEEVHRFFGDFSEQALAQSDFLIDRLVERA